MQLVVKKLSKSFGDKKVLRNINLEVEKGEIIGIIGPSGCGKSTLLRSINFLETPTSGDIILNDIKVDAKTNLNKLRQQIGMVFQQFNLFENLTVMENIILSPVKLKLMSRAMAQNEARKLLKKIDLLDKQDAYPASLSGGQKQRIAIVRALVMQPEIILFDEPTSALDPEMVGEVTKLMQDVALSGVTILVVSHELEFVRNFATRTVFMDNGKIVEQGSSDEIFDHPKNKRLIEFLAQVKNK